jgi:hypothetical protein
MAAPTAALDDDEVVLPSRVATSIHRAQVILDAAQLAVDTRNATTATAAFKALPVAIKRADAAARTQMAAVPTDPEAETTAGPDSVLAVLALEQGAITSIAGLFDGQGGATVDSATHALFGVMNLRDKLVAAVIALPPEGEGAAYADGMADSVGGYDDEVANITEALAVDKLSTGGRKVLTAALAQSKKTQEAVTAAFGGGE